MKEKIFVRLVLIAIPLALGGCNINSDAANEQVTLEYNQQRIRDAAVKAGQTARNVASGAGNVVAATGRAIKNEVGGIDVDVDVRRTPTQNRQ
jgi:hypothetical protein